MEKKMRVLLFLLSCMLLAGCASTKATSPMKMQETNAVQNAAEKRECQVSPPDKTETKQKPKLRQSTPGTFCGDKDVSDDF